MSKFDFTSETDDKVQRMMEGIAGYSPEFQEAIREEFQRRGLQPRASLPAPASLGSPAAAKAAVRVTLSTGDIPMAYDIIDPVFAYGSSSDGFLKTANPLEAYQKVANVLKQNAVAVGGDGVIHATFDYRVATSSGCGGSGKAFEVFAYGTAVRIRAS